jgi:hypothetical protein
MKRIESRIATVLCATIVLFFMSCDVKDEGETVLSLNTEDATSAAKADDVVEGTLNILENGFSENVDGPNPFTSVSLFPNCTTITIITNGNGGTIVLDFGETCTLNNGAVVSGKINLAYGPIISGTRTINYSFEDYTYNGNGVEGGGEIFREISNENGNPQSTVNESIVVSFPNATLTATRVGLRISEWTEGFGSGSWVDNVYEITGNWETTFSNGFYRTGEVTQALVLKLNCMYLVSGILQVEQQNLTGIIDWGNGSCDNMATLTLNGIEYPIILGN